jgi:hypothetical protein
MIRVISLPRGCSLNNNKNSLLLCILNKHSCCLLSGNPFFTGNDADTKKQVHFHKDTLVIVASSKVSGNWKGKKYTFFPAEYKVVVYCTLKSYLLIK